MTLNANPILTAYVRKLSKLMPDPIPPYQARELNYIVMKFPSGEAHMTRLGLAPEGLPMLGVDITLTQHVQSVFVSSVTSPDGLVFETTQPVLIQRRHLEALEHWLEWKTMEGYFQGLALHPFVVFRNTPHMVRGELCYVADVRFSVSDGLSVAV